MVTGCPVDSGVPVAQMVASDGPYALNICRPGDHVCTNCSVQASPPVISVVSPSRRARSSEVTTVGVSSVALTCWRCSNAVNASPA